MMKNHRVFSPHPSSFLSLRGNDFFFVAIHWEVDLLVDIFHRIVGDGHTCVIAKYREFFACLTGPKHIISHHR
jgi:hypothetical protein